MLSVLQTNEIATMSTYSVTIITLYELVKAIFNNNLGNIFTKSILVKYLSAIVGWSFYIIVIRRILSNVPINVPENISDAFDDVIKYGTVFIIASSVYKGINSEKMFSGHWSKQLILLLVGYLIFGLVSQKLFTNIEKKTKHKLTDIIKHIFVFTFVHLIINKSQFISMGNHKEIVGLLSGLLLYHFQIDKMINK
jgi:hypothetical protein